MKFQQFLKKYLWFLICACSILFATYSFNKGSKSISSDENAERNNQIVKDKLETLVRLSSRCNGIKLDKNAILMSENGEERNLKFIKSKEKVLILFISDKVCDVCSSDFFNTLMTYLKSEIILSTQIKIFTPVNKYRDIKGLFKVAKNQPDIYIYRDKLFINQLQNYEMPSIFILDENFMIQNFWIDNHVFSSLNLSQVYFDEITRKLH